MTKNKVQALPIPDKKDPLENWQGKKTQNVVLAAAYDSVNPLKADRLRSCATRVVIGLKEDGTHKAVGFYSCRVRLCQVCGWRRSVKVGCQMHMILDAIRKDYADNIQYIFLTLTLRNCEASELHGTLDQMMKAFNDMARLKAFKAATKGWYRALEITHNLLDDTYHPHFHVLIAVPRRYFKDETYLSQDDWTSLWKRSMKLNYTPVVHVEKVKGQTAKAIAEVAKYTVKSSDYIIPDDWKLTCETVRLLDSALHKRRLIAFGGLMKEYHKKLNLSDPHEGDLTDDIRPEDEFISFKIYEWKNGYHQVSE